MKVSLHQQGTNVLMQNTKYVMFSNMVCIISKLILVHIIHFSKVCTVICLDEYNMLFLFNKDPVINMLIIKIQKKNKY